MQTTTPGGAAIPRERLLYAQPIENKHSLRSTQEWRDSAPPRCFPAARDFRERPRVGCDGFGECLTKDELPFTAAGDQPGFTQNLEMVRDGCGGHAAHRDDFAAIH